MDLCHASVDAELNPPIWGPSKKTLVGLLQRVAVGPRCGKISEKRNSASPENIAPTLLWLGQER